MNHFRILVVDDEENVRQSYRSILVPQHSNKELDNMAEMLFAENEMFLPEEDSFWEQMESGEAKKESSEAQYEVIEVPQGRLAVEAVKNALLQGTPFSLIFLDMRMPPGIDGMETAKQIRELDPMVEIVIMTAYSDYSFEKIIQEVGNPERLLYFRKPFDPEQIQQLSLSLTQRWLIESQFREQPYVNYSY